VIGRIILIRNVLALVGSVDLLNFYQIDNLRGEEDVIEGIGKPVLKGVCPSGLGVEHSEVGTLHRTRESKLCLGVRHGTERGMRISIIWTQLTLCEELVKALSGTGVEIATNDNGRIGQGQIETLHVILYLLEQRLNLIGFLLDFVSLCTEMNIGHVHRMGIVKTPQET
jgi:hypothetical protein